MSSMELAPSRPSRVYVNRLLASEPQTRFGRASNVLIALQKHLALLWHLVYQWAHCYRCVSDSSVLCAAAAQVHFEAEMLTFHFSFFILFILFIFYYFISYFISLSLFLYYLCRFRSYSYTASCLFLTFIPCFFPSFCICSLFRVCFKSFLLQSLFWLSDILLPLSHCRSILGLDSQLSALVNMNQTSYTLGHCCAHASY